MRGRVGLTRLGTFVRGSITSIGGGVSFVEVGGGAADACAGLRGRPGPRLGALGSTTTSGLVRGRPFFDGGEGSSRVGDVCRYAEVRMRVHVGWEGERARRRADLRVVAENMEEGKC